jgi:hypothetical protein
LNAGKQRQEQRPHRLEKFLLLYLLSLKTPLSITSRQKKTLLPDLRDLRGLR